MNSESVFTKQDANEFGVPFHLLQNWEKVMNNLWRFFEAYSKRRKDVIIESVESCINYQIKGRNKFIIGVNFINQEYLQLFVKIEGNNEFKASIYNIDSFDEEGMVQIVATIITYSESIKFISIKK